MEGVSSQGAEALEEIHCIFCGEGEASPVFEENGYQARQCQECGLIFVSPRPSAESIADLYREDAAHLSAESHIAGFGSRIGRLYARHALAAVRRHAPQGMFLEIGAGNGNVLAEARSAGFEAYGVELNPIQAEFVEDQLGIVCAASIEDIRNRTGGRSFDVVYHSDVISHFFDPIAEFQRFHELLRPGGLHIFETGNLGDVERRYFRLFQRFQLPDHLFFFSDRNLDSLLEQTGFQRVATHRYSLVPQLLLTSWLRRLRSRIRGRAALQAADSGDAPAAPAPSGDRSRLWTAFEYVVFVVRYKIGAAARKRGRPQTVVVVARKSPAIE